MPGHLEELSRPRGGTLCSEGGGQRQHHWWHPVSPLQPIEGKKALIQIHGKYSAPKSKSIPNLDTKYNVSSKAS